MQLTTNTERPAATKDLNDSEGDDEGVLAVRREDGTKAQERGRCSRYS